MFSVVVVVAAVVAIVAATTMGVSACHWAQSQTRQVVGSGAFSAWPSRHARSWQTTVAAAAALFLPSLLHFLIDQLITEQVAKP